MSDKRKMPNIHTSKDVTMPVSKNDEPGLPVKIPLSIVRWVAYSTAFWVLLTPFLFPKIWQHICGGLILGWFASQLNALIKK